MATERQFFVDGVQIDTRDTPQEFFVESVQINEETAAAVGGTTPKNPFGNMISGPLERVVL